MFLPDWCEHALDIPWTIIFAVERARIVLGMLERPDGFRMPPRRIWLDDEKLDAWITDENNRIKFEMRHGSDSWDPAHVDGPSQTQDVQIFSDDAPVT